MANFHWIPSTNKKSPPPTYKHSQSLPRLPEKDNIIITLNMAPRLTLVLSVLAVVLITCAASRFDESNPIRLVPDGLRELEDQVIQVLGRTCHVRSFARFAFRWDDEPPCTTTSLIYHRPIFMIGWVDGFWFWLAWRYEKRYESVEEMRRRFEIFAENKKLIRSTNKKGLSYKLGVNRKSTFSFLFFCL